MSANVNDTTTAPPDYSAASKRRFLIRLTAVLIGGMFLDGYILGTIGTVIGKIGTDLHVSTLWEGLIAASALLGISSARRWAGGPPTSSAASPCS